MKLHLPKALCAAVLACMAAQTIAADLDVPAGTTSVQSGAKTYGAINLGNGSTLQLNNAWQNTAVSADVINLLAAEEGDNGTIVLGHFTSGDGAVLKGRITGTTGTLKFSSDYNSGVFRGWQENDFTANVEVVKARRYGSDGDKTLTFDAESQLTKGGDIKAWGASSNAVTISNNTGAGLIVAFTGLTAGKDYTLANSISTSGNGGKTLSFDRGNVNLTGALTVDKEMTISSGEKVTLSGGLSIASGVKMNVAGNVVVASDNTVAGRIHQSGSGTLTFGNGTDTDLTALKALEVGDIGSSTASSSVVVSEGYTLKITGSDNGDNYKDASLLIGEWQVATTADVDGTLLSKDARMGLGNQGGTLNINGTGVVALKGVARAVKDTSASTSFTLNMQAGSLLVLGDTGISDNIPNFTSNLAGGTIASSAETMTIGKQLSVSGNVTFDTTRYVFAADGNSIAAGDETSDITVSGGINASAGVVTKTGSGTLILGGENTFAGGLKVSEGELAVAEGGKLTLAFVDGIVDNAGTISFGENSTLVLGDGSRFINAGETLTVGTLSGLDSATVEGIGRRQSLSYADGVITVNGASSIVWKGTEDNHVWNTAAENQIWTESGAATAFVAQDSVTFGTLADGVSNVVTIAGDVAADAIEVHDAYTLDVTSDSTLGARIIRGTGSFTKTGASTLTIDKAPTASMTVSEGTLEITSALGETADLSNMKAREDGTLKVSLNTGAKGTTLTLAADSDGAVEVASGLLNFGANAPSTIGTSKLVLDNGSGIVFAFSGAGESTVSNAIEAKGSVTLQTWGAGTTTSTNKLTGAITGESGATLQKTDGGTLTISGDLSGYTGSVRVNGGTLNLSASATADSMTGIAVYNNGTQLNLGGEGTYTVDNFRMSAGGDGNTATTTIGGDVTLHITGTTLSVDGGTASFMLGIAGGHAYANVEGTLISDAGFSVRDGQGHLVIKDGGEAVLNKGLAFKHNGSWSNGYIDIQSGGTLTLGNTDGNAPDDHLHISIADGATLAAGAEGTTSVNFANADVSFGDNAVINLSAGAEKTLDMTNNLSGLHGLKLVGDGSKTFAGTVETDSIEITGGDAVFNGSVTLTDSFTVAEGTELTFKGAVTVGSTITANGTITMEGTGASLTISGLDGLDSTVNYSDGANGFISGTTYTVIKADAEKSYTLSGITTVSVNNEDHTLQESGNSHIITFEGGAADGKYYINSDSVTYGDSGNSANTATGLVLNGGSLVLAETPDATLTDGILAKVDSDITINKDVQLAKSSITRENGASVTLHGAGEYYVGSRTGESGFPAMDATLGSDWNGVVTITGTAGNLDVDAYSNGNTSKVKLVGVSAWLTTKATNNTVLNAPLILENGTGSDNAYGLNIYALSDRQYEINSAISGSGDLTITAPEEMNGSNGLTFQGDYSEWTGNLIQASTKKRNIKFTSGATSIAANIVNKGAGINLTIDNASDVAVSGSISSEGTASGSIDLVLAGAGVKTFTKDVTVASTTIEGGQMEVSNGSTFTTGVTTIKQLGTDNAVVSVNEGATGAQTVGVGNGNLTFGAADITVNSDADVAINAKLDGSKLSVKGADGTAATDATVTVNVEEGSTNDFNATDGSITVNAQTASIGTAEVGAGKTLTIGDGTGTATITTEATVAGEVAGNVIVASKATYTAQEDSMISGDVEVQSQGNYTADAGSIVGGNVTVANQGNITLTSTDGLLVAGNLNLASGATLTATSIMDVTGKEAGYSFVLATVEGTIDATNLANVTVSYIGTLGENLEVVLGVRPFETYGALGTPQNQLVATLTSTQVTPPASDVTYAGAQWKEGALLVTVDGTLDPAAAKLALLVTDAQWKEMVQAVTSVEGQTVGTPVGITLTDGATTIDLTNPGAFTGTVSFNGYVGEGNGLYEMQFIPEPATGTLSVLALAALAARRRRKH